MNRADARAGIWLMVLATFVFAAQDALSRYLASTYNVLLVVTIRYWFFAVFVIALSARRPGGVRAIAVTRRPLLQIARGLLLAAEVCVMVLAFTYLGLIDSLAIFICYPLLIAALSGPMLGEHVGWRRWIAITLGFVGILIVLGPGLTVFSPYALIPLLSACMFALYGILTRMAARHDGSDTSFFWTGIVGAVGMTLVGIWHWEPMTMQDYGRMAILCVSGALGHWLLIRAYELAETGVLQPFAYLHLIWGSAIGILVFGEDLRQNVVLGTVIVVGAGLFTLWRERVRAS